MSAAAEGRENLDEKLAEIKRENDTVLARRERLLAQNGFPQGYDDPVFECPLCLDSGYIGLKFCDCVKKALNTKTYTGTGLGKALTDKDFDGFSLKYYSGKDSGDGLSERENMTIIYNSCRRYASGFSQSSGSLLMMGGTGLGKTHLSAAIAREVVGRGFWVLYESAQNIFDSYEAVRFGREPREIIKKYESCDLLLIDDLGAECITQYTTAVFFSLLNWRTINSLPTVISTNLSPQQIKKNYGERVYSRLMGEFLILRFTGRDIRMLKLSADQD